MMETGSGRVDKGGGFKMCARLDCVKGRQSAHVRYHGNSVPSSLSHWVAASHLRSPVLIPLPLPSASRSAKSQSYRIP